MAAGLNFGFTGVVFDGGDFDGAEFSGGTVDFRRAELSGGEVDCCDAGDWSVPPVFPWADAPPPGVTLPRKEDQSR